MFNDFFLDLAKIHLKELFEEAEVGRLLKRSRAGRRGFQDRFLLNIGDLLISFGVSLKERQKPISHSTVKGEHC